jgi:hypothetical protein
MTLRNILIFLLLSLSYTVCAQESDMELAEYYYNQGMFEQA